MFCEEMTSTQEKKADFTALMSASKSSKSTGKQAEVSLTQVVDHLSSSEASLVLKIGLMQLLALVRGKYLLKTLSSCVLDVLKKEEISAKEELLVREILKKYDDSSVVLCSEDGGSFDALIASLKAPLVDIQLAALDQVSLGCCFKLLPLPTPS